ncbi:MAG: class I SAM-dependent methyltransferase [Actinobacteria bacterium]|nr:class I SAM-dependent methyltransferase [Actinomycetota bacterium]
MRKNLYQEMYRLEESHWWHIAKREITLKLLKKYFAKNNPKILDIGCGTGKNLEELSKFGETWGVDASDEAISYCRKRKFKNLKLSKAENTGFKKNTFDIVTAFDLLEHIDDKKAVEEIKKILKPKGLIIVTVPAYKKLWSKWDEILNHKRRYNEKQITELFPKKDFEILKISYFNSFLVIPAYFIRKAKSSLYSKDYPSDFKLGSPLINNLMLAISRIEQIVIRKGKVPFGTSIVCLIQKK